MGASCKELWIQLQGGSLQEGQESDEKCHSFIEAKCIVKSRIDSFSTVSEDLCAVFVDCVIGII